MTLWSEVLLDDLWHVEYECMMLPEMMEVFSNVSASSRVLFRSSD
ncbi:hypothetical protein HanRHA438_Chr01g0035741 [Helianthus annuus]|uniref:Uncharacterized protein n=1 Tax=Helianthus annuus TaxID=4232 RepID=A0A9K3JYQ6_HELAN|nr:hypothetical protein HanXRQr2_Chr01g0034911 [Helianthus annuus]KAJ0949163.1 hypothetical protein HanRHA438_Chr01g0035741 [Helianthus annuus]